ncbi:hypothetical protein [Rathayibacter sp. AY1C5]|uniref:hypothetical protein n=1 Tax=Rathayibacter sp. AY1C5 TaxID=2080538 RepID=UPI000CE90BA8|nr:hypothetical protein [Rathayibacter sp. AY1C5]PPG60259.1 hypothetical protein C5C57_05515 [Rathayibacter sp. AY1C5]
MTRQLAITKRTTLDQFEGWSDCYVEWRPSTYGDSFKLRATKVEGVDEETAFTAILDLVKEHIVGGKVRVVEDGEVKLVDFEKSDIDLMPTDMVDRIFADITGVEFEDPKGSATTQSLDEPNPSESTSVTS